MLTVKIKFLLYDLGDKNCFPMNAKQSVWCSFNTGHQKIMCSISFDFSEKNLYYNTWYNGIIDLPYGHRFVPFCPREESPFSETIMLGNKYFLNNGDLSFGECILMSVEKCDSENSPI